MAKKKNSESLFEVLSTNRGSVEVPEWMRKGADKSLPPEAEDSGEASQEPHTQSEESPAVAEVGRPEEIEKAPDVETEYEDEVEEDVEDEEDEVEQAAAADKGAATLAGRLTPPSSSFFATWRPMWRIEGDRIHFSLSFVTAMVVLGGVGVLLVAAFVLGRVTGGSGQTRTAPGTGSADEVPGRVESTTRAERSDGPVRAVSGRRDPSRHYIIVETLKSNKDADKVEAEQIIEFCKLRDIPADMVLIGRKPNTRVAVWSLLGFESNNSPDAIQHAEKVEEIGREYFEKHKTYKFLQRRNGEFSPFFYRGRSENAGD